MVINDIAIEMPLRALTNSNPAAFPALLLKNNFGSEP